MISQTGKLEAAAAVVSMASKTPEDIWATPLGKNPFLVIHGTSDQVAPPENGELMKKEMGDLAELVSIEGVGYLIIINHGQETTGSFLYFLNSKFE